MQFTSRSHSGPGVLLLVNGLCVPFRPPEQPHHVQICAAAVPAHSNANYLYHLPPFANGNSNRRTQLKAKGLWESPQNLHNSPPPDPLSRLLLVNRRSQGVFGFRLRSHGLDFSISGHTSSPRLRVSDYYLPPPPNNPSTSHHQQTQSTPTETHFSRLDLSCLAQSPPLSTHQHT